MKEKVQKKPLSPEQLAASHNNGKRSTAQHLKRGSDVPLKMPISTGSTATAFSQPKS